jgi:hypothetical protein
MFDYYFFYHIFLDIQKKHPYTLQEYEFGREKSPRIIADFYE